MNLELATDEARELKAALDIHLIEMRGELVNTDDRAYRADLKQTLERLERVADKLDNLLHGGEKKVA